MKEVGAALLSFYLEFRVLINSVLIVLLAVFANWALRRLLMRTVTQVVRGVKRAQDVDTTSEMQAAPYVNARAVQRTRTLGTVGRHIISWTVVIVALILILAQLGVNLGAVLTSAGIVAAGLAFGAQNIVKDILNGIFMVFEDQLGIGDVVTIGTINGTVEDVGIRITQVRALDGTLWHIRNGEILTLGNSSQGWGRALIDVTVDADQDLTHVSEVTLEAARALLTSEKYARKVTGQPEILGLESVFGDRATLRLAVRTRPEAQWEVQRGIRAELRRKFREEGIALSDERPTLPGGTA
ncbi:small conductance mechanosensitive channel [Leucobacter luti]|uniref:Small conductance mechanosensitive channel n=1 Tax=Leucobacter luti TaxID=340320 RepID=A0A4R6RTY3_9MICO|nr:mechanosensitive ion channel family protein [Leucobacter luti]MCW2288072.1 small conductance mechanosensitive channel [Leucobacter luti]TCK45766.1 small conductance mechanosensitive channel [Leucobacter luti]TDP90342.1 small conductance mechanosensitive channel [Leucobacter luti]